MNALRDLFESIGACALLVALVLVAVGVMR